MEKEGKGLKALLIASLVVALVELKSILTGYIDKKADPLLYFVIFVLALAVVSIIEFVFEKLDKLSIIKKILEGHNYIQGTWLNYAEDKKTGEIFNFALLRISYSDHGVNVDGRTFSVCSDINNNLDIVNFDGHFFSTINHYKRANGLLTFNFTVDSSAKVKSCGHKLFGTAEYFFNRGKGAPSSFTGDFLIPEKTNVSCSVVGHKLNEGIINPEKGLAEQYKKIIYFAIDNEWITLDKISRCSGKDLSQPCDLTQ